MVSVPEIFAYWLQAGRIDVGFLGAAQIDRYGNINSTVIGPYDSPRVRLPGAGGAPEIAASVGEVIVLLRQTDRAFVERTDFRTSVGFGDGPGSARSWACGDGAHGRHHRPRGAAARPGHLRAGADRAAPGRAPSSRPWPATGWPLQVAAELGRTAPPTDQELAALRELEAA